MKNKNKPDAALTLAQSLEYLELARIRGLTVSSAGFIFALKYDIVKLAHYFTFTKISLSTAREFEIGCIAVSLLELAMDGTQLKLTTITYDTIAQLPPMLRDSINQAILTDCQALTAQVRAFAITDNK